MMIEELVNELAKQTFIWRLANAKITHHQPYGGINIMEQIRAEERLTGAKKSKARAEAEIDRIVRKYVNTNPE